LYRGSRGRVYRPNATLMILLKMRRLSERDLADCELVLATRSEIDRGRLVDALSALPPTDDTELTTRRLELRRLIGEH
jgi:hypothetical protein